MVKIRFMMFIAIMFIALLFIVGIENTMADSPNCGESLRKGSAKDIELQCFVRPFEIRDERGSTCIFTSEEIIVYNCGPELEAEDGPAGSNKPTLPPEDPMYKCQIYLSHLDSPVYANINQYLSGPCGPVN